MKKLLLSLVAFGLCSNMFAFRVDERDEALAKGYGACLKGCAKKGNAQAVKQCQAKCLQQRTAS